MSSPTRNALLEELAREQAMLEDLDRQRERAAARILALREQIAAPAAREPSLSQGELLKATEQCAEERRRKEAERAERERARKEREVAASRDRHLDSLAKREALAWDELRALVATKQPAKYDEAVQLLRDLRDLGLRNGRADEVAVRVRKLCVEHARKPSFIERLRKAGLDAEAQP